MSALHWHDFEAAVRAWTLTLQLPGSPAWERPQLALDGKVQRGSLSVDPATGNNQFVATVNFWAATHGLIINQDYVKRTDSGQTRDRLLAAFSEEHPDHIIREARVPLSTGGKCLFARVMVRAQ